MHFLLSTPFISLYVFTIAETSLLSTNTQHIPF